MNNRRLARQLLETARLLLENNNDHNVYEIDFMESTRLLKTDSDTDARILGHLLHFEELAFADDDGYERNFDDDEDWERPTMANVMDEINFARGYTKGYAGGYRADYAGGYTEDYLMDPRNTLTAYKQVENPTESQLQSAPYMSVDQAARMVVNNQLRDWFQSKCPWVDIF